MKRITKVYQEIIRRLNAKKYAKSPKVFCIGKNKTGTTSVEVIFNKIGLAVGPQVEAELLLRNWAKNDFKPIINYVKYRGTAFQDIPFSVPKTYKVMDKAFPNSKFILTIRDSPEVWYKSLTTFHGKLFGKEGGTPTKQDLMNATYIHKGWAWEAKKLIGLPFDENDIYNKEYLIKNYVDYNNEVMKYFKDQPEKLLVINLKEANAAKKICEFIGSNIIIEETPWANKT